MQSKSISNDEHEKNLQVKKVNLLRLLQWICFYDIFAIIKAKFLSFFVVTESELEL